MRRSLVDLFLFSSCVVSAIVASEKGAFGQACQNGCTLISLYTWGGAPSCRVLQNPDCNFCVGKVGSDDLCLTTSVSGSCAATSDEQFFKVASTCQPDCNPDPNQNTSAHNAGSTQGQDWQDIGKKVGTCGGGGGCGGGGSDGVCSLPRAIDPMDSRIALGDSRNPRSGEQRRAGAGQHLVLFVDR